MQKALLTASQEQLSEVEGDSIHGYFKEGFSEV
jgi:hypothetical protein